MRTRTALFLRNKYLVTNADLLLAAYDGLPGGTKRTIELARREGVSVLIIPPVSDCDPIDLREAGA